MSPVLDVGMTREEQQAASGKVPPDEGDHLLMVDGLFKEAYTSERGNYVLPLRIRVASGESEGRTFPAWLTVGTFSFDDFCDATGFTWSGRTFATEDLQGLTFFGTIEHQFEDQDGNELEHPRCNLTRIWSAAGTQSSSEKKGSKKSAKVPFD